MFSLHTLARWGVLLAAATFPAACVATSASSRGPTPEHATRLPIVDPKERASQTARPPEDWKKRIVELSGIDKEEFKESPNDGNANTHAGHASPRREEHSDAMYMVTLLAHVRERLVPERSFAFRGYDWRQRYEGTSVVVFTRRPMIAEAAYYKAVCQAWLSTFYETPDSRVPNNARHRDRAVMSLFWPLDEFPDGPDKFEDCDYLVRHYDLVVGQEIAAAVDTQQGPLLVAWRRDAPERKISVGLQSLRSPQSLTEAFEAWRHRIQYEPSIWKADLQLATFRGALRDFLNSRATVLLCIVGGGRGNECARADGAGVNDSGWLERG